MTILTLGALIDRHGVDVLDHLDRSDLVPVLTGLQFQGDVAVIPTHAGYVSSGGSAPAPIPSSGVAVVRGEAGGNTHLLLAAGDGVTWSATRVGATVGEVNVPEGAAAFLAHPEHGYLGIGPGCYAIRRQREQAAEERLVAD